MLDDLSRPAGESLEPGLHRLVLELHLDGAVAFGLPRPGQGQAALLGLIRVGGLNDFRVEHDHRLAYVVKDDDPLIDADHIRRHSNAAVGVGF